MEKGKGGSKGKNTSSNMERTKTLIRNFKEYLKNKKEDDNLVKQGKPKKNYPYFDAMVKPKNMGVWYIKIHGLSSPYIGGEYIVEIRADNNHPYKPPKYYFRTPNGLYQLNKNACINIGSYHADQYPAALGMLGFANQLIAAMLQWEDLGAGISLIDTSSVEKARLALQSKQYNIDNNKKILDLFAKLN